MSGEDEDNSDGIIPSVVASVARAVHDVSSLLHPNWHPISTVPFNQDVELRVIENGISATLSFPCRRTNNHSWINVDLGSTIVIEPVEWRVWQHSLSPQVHHTPLDLNGHDALIHTHGAIKREDD